MRESESDLKKHQCSVCGCICFSAPKPYSWEKRKTPSGTIQLCCGCEEQYAGVVDPVKERRLSNLYARLARAERAARMVGKLEAEIDRLLGESQ